MGTKKHNALAFGLDKFQKRWIAAVFSFIFFLTLFLVLFALKYFLKML